MIVLNSYINDQIFQIEFKRKLNLDENQII